LLAGEDVCGGNSPNMLGGSQSHGEVARLSHPRNLFSRCQRSVSGDGIVFGRTGGLK
jgi:hypothetical protein